jgi:hypothetical protein
MSNGSLSCAKYTYVFTALAGTGIHFLAILLSSDDFVVLIVQPSILLRVDYEFRVDRGTANQG